MSVENDQVCEICESFIDGEDRLASTITVKKNTPKGHAIFLVLLCRDCGREFRPVAQGPVDLHSPKTGRWTKPNWPSSFFDGEK